MAMFLVHMQAKLASYHRFDRFIYAQAAILLGGKLIDQIENTESIVMEFRNVLRIVRNRAGTDSEAKIKYDKKKVDEAEINIMINLGFDLEVFSGMSFLFQWKRLVNNGEHYDRAKKLTS